MREIDGWLIDRAFQPACDRLGRWVTCFDLARACGVALVLAATVEPIWCLLQDVPPAVVLAVTSNSLASATAAVLYLLAVGRTERRTGPLSANPLGLQGALRLTLCAMHLAFLVLDLRPPNQPVVSLMAAEHVLWLLAFYLVSCTPRPPLRRESRMPRGLFQGG